MSPSRVSDISLRARRKSGEKSPRWRARSLFFAFCAAPRSTCASSTVRAIGVSSRVQKPRSSDMSACFTWSTEHVAMSTTSMSRSSSMSVKRRNIRQSGKSFAIMSRRSLRRSHAATTLKSAGCALNTG